MRDPCFDRATYVLDAWLEDRFVCMSLRNTHLIPFYGIILSFYIRLLWAQQVQVSCFVQSCFVLFLFSMRFLPISFNTTHWSGI